MSYKFTAVNPQCTIQGWNSLVLIWNAELENCLKIYTVSGTQHTYLPLSAIHHFATHTTITNVIHLGIRLGQYNLDEPQIFIDSIFARARKLFTYIIHAGLDMNYLIHILMRGIWDVSLPIKITVPPPVINDTHRVQNIEEAREARRIGHLVRHFLPSQMRLWGPDDVVSNSREEPCIIN